MPPRRNLHVTYWTGWLSPEMEGCSKEVFGLAGHFRHSRVFGLSQYYLVKMSRSLRYFGLSVRLYPLFRLLAPLWEAASDVSHIYGNLSEWFFLRALRRRPIIMTVATETLPLAAESYAHVKRYVTHSADTAEKMVGWGFDREKITLIYPGIDLDRLRPAPRPAEAPFGATTDSSRFRILYATAPNWLEGLTVKGVELMMRAAAELPDVDFYLLWRPWTDAVRLAEQCQRVAPPNVHIIVKLVSDMPAAYHASDATIAPFTSETGMKICPTSLIESLACGRPILVSNLVGIASLVRNEACGVVFEPTVDGLVRGVNELRSGYDRYAARARQTAEQHFDLRVCYREHARLYDEVLGRAEAS